MKAIEKDINNAIRDKNCIKSMDYMEIEKKSSNFWTGNLKL